MKLAIVGIFYDGYEDLWYDFINLFYKNWEKCPYDLYIVNNTKELNSEYHLKDKVHIIHAGEDAEYSKKVQVAINKIDADYYLLLLEDFFVCSKLGKDALEKILYFIDNEKIEYYSMRIPEFGGKKLPDRYCEDNDVRKYTIDKPYLLTCQPAIWKREFLKLCIGEENYNAWIFEGIYARSSIVRNSVFLNKCVQDYTNPLELHHGAVQGKMLRSIMRKFAEMDYVCCTTREVYSICEEFKHNLKITISGIINFLHLKKILKLNKNGVLNKYSEQIDYYKGRVITKEKIDYYIKHFR